MKAIQMKVLGTAVAMILTVVGCDTTATFRVEEVQFDPVSPFRVISATPVQRDPATQQFAPACSAGTSPDGVRITFALKSTEQKGNTAGNKDRLVREGDKVDGRVVTVGPGQAIAAEKFRFGINSIVDEVQAFDGSGTLGKNKAITPSAVRFIPRTENKNEAVAVALLIDHSGSMLGKVDPDKYFEVRTLGSNQPIAEKTDQLKYRFKTAGDYLVANLNESDQLIGWTFNETGLRLLCGQSQVTDVANEPTAIDEQNCFTTNHALYYDNQTGLGGLSEISNSSAEGRTPLWRAVQHAWNFLNTNAAGRTKHIVVVTDSPDTCAANGDWWTADSPCSGAGEVSYTDFKTVLNGTAFEARIPVSFIQMQSKGYESPDPAQMETACLTGGTYQWVNNLDYALTDTVLQRALTNAFTNVRDTLSGVWELDAEFQVLTDGSINAGKVAALDGSVELSGTNLLTKTETVLFNKAETLSNQEDTRLLVRTSCSEDTDCPGNFGECDSGCLVDGNGCVGKSAPLMTDEACCCGALITELEADPLFQCTALYAPCCGEKNKDCEGLE